MLFININSSDLDFQKHAKEHKVMEIMKLENDPEVVLKKVKGLLDAQNENGAKFNINYQDYNSGDSFLLCLLKRPCYSFDLAIEFINRGINVNLRDRDKKKAFSLIIPWKNNIDIAKALIKSNTIVGDSLRVQSKYYAKKHDNYAIDRLLTVTRSVALVINGANREENEKVTTLKRILKRNTVETRKIVLCRLFAQGHFNYFHSVVSDKSLESGIFSDAYALGQIVRLWERRNEFSDHEILIRIVKKFPSLDLPR